ncbi:TrkH family potassium uptake protein [Pseudoflavonifractor phocaeensis]|uniref:TrkH family potassium uptake protein n=1 Tax=Pseudoflavonifractor phocaeensis TaxID=1870988 RepID=UPI0019590139|nr:TrkH family potassium uptake protein [Pseudoflavonifractor phocaeensis]MBM6926755.1 TrkH family potassium uptake protein [Pseudoflavonifractor phocaeensis]
MNFRLVFKVTGKTLMVGAMAMLIPMLVSLLYQEDPTPFLITIPLMMVVGFLLSLLKSDDHFFTREGFFAVALIWLLMGAFGALPFYFSGYFPTYIDCFFESVSGFTTTGSSILTAVEPLPYGILFWRSFTHWLGGMGVLILTIALLPSLGARTLHLMKAESPGPVVSKLVPKSSQSSKILYGIYCALTAIQVICLRLAGMPWYDSIVHAFATAGTGGFSTKNLSIAAYGSPAIEIIITIFMLLFSVNFSLYFLILCGKVRQALRSDELRFFLAVVAISVVLITVNISPLYNTLGESIRHAAFQVGTVISTTGFASTDFNLWPEFSRVLLVLLMFIGACAGSTGGAIKCSRVLLLFKCIHREIRQVIHPRAVNVVKLDGKVMDENSLRSVHIFFAAYMLITLGATLLVSVDNYSFGTTFTAVVTCIGNIGPGLEMVGPMGNFSIFSGFSKLVLSMCMIIGRLEILPILVLFSGNAWKRS